MLEAFLAAMDYQVTVANDGQAGLDTIAAEDDFDLILLDVMMPIKDGFDVLRTLRQSCVTPVIMLTARGDDYDRILGLELGADDYLPKPFNHRELVARMKAIVRRRTQYDDHSESDTLEIGELMVNPSAQQAMFHSQVLDLTGTEFGTLHLLATKKGTLVTKAVISEHVLGRKLMEYDRSIDMHVSNIRKKLAAIEPTPVIKTVRGAGYILLC